MATQLRTPGYAYNASAIGFGGVLQKGDVRTVVPTIASVCLSPSGGEASTSFDNYYCDGLSFARAQSRVSGWDAPSLRGGPRRHITYSEVYLTDLRIFGRVRVALMQATMTATREIFGNQPPAELEHDRTEFDIHVIYRGVVIDGKEVEPDVDIDLCSTRRYAAFADTLLKRPKPEILLLSDENGIKPTDLHAIKKAGKPFVGPLVREVKGVPAGRGKGHKVKLDKFGNVKFAELLVKPDRQRFNLLRLDLDGDWVTDPQPFSADVRDVAPALTAAVRRTSRRSAIIAADDPVASASGGSGDGGSLSGGGGGSNGVPVYP